MPHVGREIATRMPHQPQTKIRNTVFFRFSEFRWRLGSALLFGEI